MHASSTFLKVSSLRPLHHVLHQFCISTKPVSSLFATEHPPWATVVSHCRLEPLRCNILSRGEWPLPTNPKNTVNHHKSDHPWFDARNSRLAIVLHESRGMFRWQHHCGCLINMNQSIVCVMPKQYDFFYVGFSTMATCHSYCVGVTRKIRLCPDDVQTWVGICCLNLNCVWC